MKRNAIITLVIMLAIAGVISYGIIWYRKRTATAAPAADTATGGTTTGTTTVNTGTTGTGYALPKVETYGWWINKIGHASFPLGLRSTGVEVLKVQEVLNSLSVAKGLPKIAEDGVWGLFTDERFKKLFPMYNSVTQFMFMTDFDPNREILK